MINKGQLLAPRPRGAWRPLRPTSGSAVVSCLGVLCLTGCPDTTPHVLLTDTPGVVTTLAGSSQGYADGKGSEARFNQPQGIAMAADGSVFVADTENHRIRRISPDGNVTTLAGGDRGFADGSGASARFWLPKGLAVDSRGNLYVADFYNHLIRKVTPDGTVSTLAGSAQAGHADGSGEKAKFYGPEGVLSLGNEVFVADAGNNRIRRISAEGTVSTYAGLERLGMKDGTLGTATFMTPSGLASDGAGHLLVADRTSHRIRRISPDGRVETYAGTSHFRSGLAVPVGGYVDGPGANARFSQPQGLATDGRGNLYVADWGNSVIRKVDSSGQVTTLAGGQGPADDFGLWATDGTGREARFRQPGGITMGPDGTLYVADTKNHRIRRIRIP